MHELADKFWLKAKNGAVSRTDRATARIQREDEAYVNANALSRPPADKMLHSLICLSCGPPDQAAPFGMGSGRQSRPNESQGRKQRLASGPAL